MILGVYSIRDRFTGFLQPTFEQNDQVALRNFQHAILQGGSLLSSHSQDYDLCKIGQFNSETGLIVAHEPYEVLVNGMSIHLKSIKEASNGNV